MINLFQCPDCGAISNSRDCMEEHMIVEHPDEMVTRLVRQACREALEIAELKRMFELRVL